MRRALALRSLNAHYRDMGRFGRILLLGLIALVGFLSMIFAFDSLSSYYPTFHEPWFLAVTIVLYSVFATVVGAILSGGDDEEA